jgi:8-oxo-dGTP pyrophosphatase MutT (NUDIX family)
MIGDAARFGAEHPGARAYPEYVVATFAQLPVGLRRRLYRLAYGGLSVYWFLTRPSKQGVKCVITDGERVLLVRHTYGPPEWDLPGGAMKPREAPVDTARREMHEELGVAIDNWQALGDVAGRVSHRRDTVHCFHAELHNPAFTLDLGELYTAEWFPRAALPTELGQYVHPILARLESASASEPA